MMRGKIGRGHWRGAETDGESTDGPDQELPHPASPDYCFVFNRI
jgi:hypothetical protein